MLEFDIDQMEPMLPVACRALDEFALDLVAKASGLASQFSPKVRDKVGQLVRSMNCYYSNLIRNGSMGLKQEW